MNPVINPYKSSLNPLIIVYSYGHGYSGHFYGVIHAESINGILLVLISGITRALTVVKP